MRSLRRKSHLIIVVFILIFSFDGISFEAPQEKNEKNTTIFIGLFIGDFEDPRVLDQAKLYTSDAYPQLNLWKKPASNSRSLFKSTCVDAVLGVMDLEKVDIMGFYDKPWPDKKGTIDYFIASEGMGWLYSS